MGGGDGGQHGGFGSGSGGGGQARFGVGLCAWQRFEGVVGFFFLGAHGAAQQFAWFCEYGCFSGLGGHGDMSRGGGHGGTAGLGLHGETSGGNREASRLDGDSDSEEVSHLSLHLLFFDFLAGGHGPLLASENGDGGRPFAPQLAW